MASKLIVNEIEHSSGSGTSVSIPNITLGVGSDADGDMYYRASGALARLAKGTDDHVLTMNGNVPNWEASAGGGKILQLVSYIKTDPEDTTSTTPANMVGDQGSGTVSCAFSSFASTSSKVYLAAHLGGVMNTSGANGIYFKFTGGNAATALIGDATTGQECITSLRPRVDIAYTQWNVNVGPVIDSPSTISATTYTLQWWVEGHTGKVNEVETHDAAGGNTIVSMIAMEIGA